MTLMSGADIVLESLKRIGVDTVFGYPGGVVLPLYDRFPAHPEVRHILVRHEQGAGHAADGYASASGKLGVALATSGPGATNLVTAITTAHMDSVPTLFITGNVGRELLGRDGFQEADITGIKLAYAGVGARDPYSGFEARVVPENITLLPKTGSQVTGGNGWSERAVTAKKGDNIANILKEIGAVQDEIAQIAESTTQGFAAGGLVNYDPNEIDTIVSKLKEEFHG